MTEAQEEALENLCETLPGFGVNCDRANPCTFLRVLCRDGGEVTAFNLSGLGLTSIPIEVREFGGLNELDLSNNDLCDFVADFFTTLKPQILDLSDNRWTSLPSDFANFQGDLVELRMNQNYFNEVPPFLSEFFALQVLEMRTNLITEIPSFLGNLPALQYLDLSVNQIDQWTSSTEKAPFASLIQLTLTYNLLTNIPEHVLDSSNVQMVDLQANRFETFPQAVMLPTVLELFLHDNSISSIPNSIDDMTDLQVLNLSNNLIEVLPTNFQNLASLTTLFLSENSLRAISAEFANLSSLEILALEGNQLTSESIHPNFSNLNLSQLMFTDSTNCFGQCECLPYPMGSGPCTCDKDATQLYGQQQCGAYMNNQEAVNCEPKTCQCQNKLIDGICTEQGFVKPPVYTPEVRIAPSCNEPGPTTNAPTPTPTSATATPTTTTPTTAMPTPTPSPTPTPPTSTEVVLPCDDGTQQDFDCNGEKIFITSSVTIRDHLEFPIPVEVSGVDTVVTVLVRMTVDGDIDFVEDSSLVYQVFVSPVTPVITTTGCLFVDALSIEYLSTDISISIVSVPVVSQALNCPEPNVELTQSGLAFCNEQTSTRNGVTTFSFNVGEICDGANDVRDGDSEEAFPVYLIVIIAVGAFLLIAIAVMLLVPSIRRRILCQKSRQFSLDDDS